jgi:hypothetical protein
MLIFSSVLDRTKSSQSELDSIVIVIMHVVFRTDLQVVDAAKFVQIGEFRLERAEEAFHRSVVSRTMTTPMEFRLTTR